MADQLLHVTVRGGLTGVNRVVGLVRHRGTGPVSITARATADADTWVIMHALDASEEQTVLLQKQLERLPCVVSVLPAKLLPSAAPKA